ncbi:MAG: hypothetical protein LC122_12350 [Chitinophagales bacterium]|nr:hypothetical protein [Chitinophagales bacterium]
MMSVDNYLNKIKGYLDSVEKFLSEQTTFPIKVETVMAKLQTDFNLNAYDKRKVDTIVRMFLSQHDKYEISVGVKGGIRLRQEDKSSKSSKIKEQVKENIDKKLESMKAQQKPIEISSDNDDFIEHDAGAETETDEDLLD